MVALAQGMAAAHSAREAWRAAAVGGCLALGGSFAALSVWERELGRLRVLVNVGRRAEDEEEFPEDESYPVHQFAEITEFLHERWAGGGEPDAWVETARGPAAGRPGYVHQRVAALRRRGRGCCVVAPIVLHGRAWGELYVARPVGERVFERGDADFATVLASVVAAGIAQTERLEEVRRLAYTDALTGLANRRAVDAALDEAVERHREEDVVVSLVVCDLNGLKRVNDTHGHAVGDRLLERFGSVLSLCGAMLPGRWPRGSAGTSSVCSRSGRPRTPWSRRPRSCAAGRPSWSWGTAWPAGSRPPRTRSGRCVPPAGCSGSRTPPSTAPRPSGRPGRSSRGARGPTTRSCGSRTSPPGRRTESAGGSADGTRRDAGPGKGAARRAVRGAARAHL